MEFTWKENFSRVNIYKKDSALIGTIHNYDSKVSSVGEFEFYRGFGNASAYDRQRNHFEISYNIATGFFQGLQPILLQIGETEYEFVYESKYHCYIQSNNNVLISQYRDSGWFKKKGLITISDDVEKHELLIYALFLSKSAFISANNG